MAHGSPAHSVKTAFWLPDMVFLSVGRNHACYPFTECAGEPMAHRFRLRVSGVVREQQSRATQAGAPKHRETVTQCPRNPAISGTAGEPHTFPNGYVHVYGPGCYGYRLLYLRQAFRAKRRRDRWHDAHVRGRQRSSRIRTAVPSPTLLSIVIRPPWASVMLRQIARPRPVPPGYPPGAADRAASTR